MRIYDSRLARFLSIDPIAPEYHWSSPYAFAENEPPSGINLDELEKDRSNKAVSLFGQGMRQGKNELKQTFWNIFSREGFRNTSADLKSSATDIFGTVRGDPNSIKSINKRLLNFSVGFSNSFQNYSTKPISWFMGIPNRSTEENIRGLGYGAWKTGEL